MGLSASSLLDESKSNFIRDQTEAELKAFSPYYSKQYSVARLAKVEDELEQQKEKITQLLQTRGAPEDAVVLYEEGVFFFDENRKWKERWMVVRANYCLECHDGLESFMKGVPPRYKLLPTGGTVLTTEEKYMAMVDKCFPDDANSVKEDFAPPLVGLPGHFPVYLRLPYRSDFYFCFREEAKRDDFLSILSDCISHQNQDSLKQKTCEVQAFLRAIQLYRQEKGHHEAWDVLMGSDVQVMANLVMEQLLPSLQKDMLPCLKAKKKDKKKVWFAVVEAAYIMVQEYLLEGLTALKNECSTSARQQEVLIHSDMDQILSSRRLVENKLKASVSEPAERFCAESVQPHLASILEELMEPISSGFQEGRLLSDSTMDQLCRDFQTGMSSDELKRALANMSRPNLQSCYQRIASLQDRLHHLQDLFGFSGATGLIHSAQIDLQQLMENAAFTFDQLLYKAIQDNPENAGSAIEKAKHRVLKQYDYDSSTVRKRIFQEALVVITLPHIKKNLAFTCKPALHGLEQLVDADHSNFVHVENVYEGILLQILEKDVARVVKEAVSLKKHNLLTDSKDLLTESSRSSLSSYSLSDPGSPARQGLAEPQPPSLPVDNSLGPAARQTSSTVGEEPQQEKGEAGVTVQGTAGMPLGTVLYKTTPAEVSITQQPALSDPPAPAEEVQVPEAGNGAAMAVASGKVETRSAETPNPAETALVTEKTGLREPAVQIKAVDTGLSLAPQPETEQTPLDTLAQAVSSTVSSAEVEDEIELVAPSSGVATVVASAEGSLGLQDEQSEKLSVSSPCLNVSAGSASSRSYVASAETSESEVSTTSDLEEEDVNTSESPLSSDDPPAGELDPALVTAGAGAPGRDASVSEDTSADANPTVAPSASGILESSEGVADAPAEEEATPSSPAPPPLDSVQVIRDLVVEVIEVEELVQRYPGGISE